MTPFGARIREYRAERDVTLKQMAGDLHISTAYLSALEHGQRGRPSAMLVQQICAYFDLFWDAAEEMERLAALSHPRVTVDTSGLAPEATELANELAQRIRRLNRDQLVALLAQLRSTG